MVCLHRAVVFALHPCRRRTISTALGRFHHRGAPTIVILPANTNGDLIVTRLTQLTHNHMLILTRIGRLITRGRTGCRTLKLRTSVFTTKLGHGRDRNGIMFNDIRSITHGLSTFRNRFSLLVISRYRHVNSSRRDRCRRVLARLAGIGPRLHLLKLATAPFQLNGN